MTDWIQLVGGGLLLYFGAEWLVGGASALALAVRIPQILIGLTVVAYGTSAPEIIVGVEAAAAGHGDVALGNVVGSNIANIGLLLGVAALIRPARVDGALRRREVPMLVANTAVVPLLFGDGVLSRYEAAGLVAVALVYTAWRVHVARTAGGSAGATLDAIVTREAADAGAPESTSTARAALIAAIGLSGGPRTAQPPRCRRPRRRQPSLFRAGGTSQSV